MNFDSRAYLLCNGYGIKKSINVEKNNQTFNKEFLVIYIIFQIIFYDIERQKYWFIKFIIKMKKVFLIFVFDKILTWITNIEFLNR